MLRIIQDTYECPKQPTLMQLLTDQILKGMPVDEAQAIVHRHVYYKANRNVLVMPKFIKARILDPEPGPPEAA